MSRQSRRIKNRRKKIIRRRRILLVLFLLLLIPLLYKGTSLVIDGGKHLYNYVLNKSEKSIGKKKSTSDKNIMDKSEKDEPIEPQIANVSLLSVGDIMFHMPQVRAAYLGDGNYDFTDTFRYVKKHISNADIAVANFETVTAGNDKRFSGFPQFNSPKETLLALKNTGFDILSTANNHCLDQGKEGILNTLKFIEEYGLKSVGTYDNEDKKFLIEERNGIKLGFLSYTYGLNGLEFYLSEEELSYMINLIDEEKIQKDIENIKKEVDAVVVFVHWGTEYQREASDSQINLGHKMVDWGADIILGSHPHVLQASEVIKKDGGDAFIIYSMGNFFSNQRNETMGNSFAEDGVMVEINIEKDITNDETIVKDINFLPTWVDKYKAGGKDKYRILVTKDVLDGHTDVDLNDVKKNRIQKSQNDSIETLNYE